MAVTNNKTNNVNNVRDPLTKDNPAKDTKKPVAKDVTVYNMADGLKDIEELAKTSLGLNELVDGKKSTK